MEESTVGAPLPPKGWRVLCHPRVFELKNSRNILTVFSLGTLPDVKFKKTRLHFMKVSDDLFCVLRPGTYSKVLTPYKVIKLIQSTTSEATLSYFPLDTSIRC